MAESGEKTEEASPQKVREAREKGQVSKSQDFVSAIVFVGAFAALAGSLTIVAEKMSEFIIACMKAISRPDLDLAAKVRDAIHLPMSVLGGAGSLADIGQLVRVCGVVGAAAGSLFVFKGSYRAVLINYPSQAQKDDVICAALTEHLSLQR